MPRLLPKPLLSLCSLLIIVLLLLAGEFICRATTHLNFSGFSKELFIKNAFGTSKGLAKHAEGLAFGVPVFTDEHGFRVPRGRPVASTAQHDALLLLGDSVGFGPGVEEDQTIAGRLRAALPDTRVYNASVPSYNTHDYQHVIEEFIPDHREIDRVYLLFCLNDVESVSSKLIDEYLNAPRADLKPAASLTTRVRTAPWIERAHELLRTRSALYLFIKNKLTNPPRRYWAEIAHYYAAGNEPYLASVLQPLADVAEFLHVRRIGFLVLISPYTYQFLGREPNLMKPQEQVRAFCAQRRIVCVDAVDALRASGLPMRRLFLPDDPDHYSPDGHAVIAQMILARERAWRSPGNSVGRLDARRPP